MPAFVPPLPRAAFLSGPAAEPWPEPTAHDGPRQLVLRLRHPTRPWALWLSVGTAWASAGPQAFAAAVYFDGEAPPATAVRAYEELWPISRAAPGAPEAAPGAILAGAHRGAAAESHAGLGVGECYLGPEQSHGLVVGADAALAWDLCYGDGGYAVPVTGRCELWQPHASRARCTQLDLSGWQVAHALWAGDWHQRLHVRVPGGATVACALDAVGRGPQRAPWTAGLGATLTRRGRSHTLCGSRPLPPPEAAAPAARGDSEEVGYALRGYGVAGRLALQATAPAGYTAQLRRIGPGVLHLSELASVHGHWRPWWGPAQALDAGRGERPGGEGMGPGAEAAWVSLAVRRG